MPQPAEQERVRRRRSGAWMIAAGIVALFVSTFTVPEALILLARVSAEVDETLRIRGAVVTVIGATTLLGGGVLVIAGFGRRRAAGQAPHPEDELVEEEFGDSPVRPYDPGRLRQRFVRDDPAEADPEEREDRG